MFKTSLTISIYLIWKRVFLYLLDRNSVLQKKVSASLSSNVSSNFSILYILKRDNKTNLLED